MYALPVIALLLLSDGSLCAIDWDIEIPQNVQRTGEIHPAHQSGVKLTGVREGSSFRTCGVPVLNCRPHYDII